MGVLQGLVDFGLLQIVFWLFTQLFGKVLLVFHLNREQAGVTAALQGSPVWLRGPCFGGAGWEENKSAGNLKVSTGIKIISKIIWHGKKICLTFIR